MKVSIDYLIEPEKHLKRELIQSWIQGIIESEKKKLGQIQIILSTDKHLLELNKEFLGHNYFTDVIVFGNNRKDIINGDIFISYERIKDNANLYRESTTKELYRIIVHGVLHLIGYNDKSTRDKEIMTEKENKYLILGSMTL